MRSSYSKLKLTIALLAFVFLNSCTSKNAPNPKKYDFSLLDNKIQSWVDSGYYSGAAIAVYKQNKRILKSAYGDYSDTTSVFIASAGKWLASATIAAVVDEGKLSWDDKVKKWLPQFMDIKGEATLRQLLSHTSGYPDYQPKPFPKDRYQSLEESVAHIVELKADTVPGVEFNYGGLAMQVAGRMAELATGKKWETLFKEKISKPLEMINTRFTPVDSAEGHAPMLGGGAKSTLNDYVRFLKMFYNRGKFHRKRILSESAISEILSDQLKGASIIAPKYVQKVQAESHKGIYGLGIWREEVNDKDNALLVSSPSWAGAYPWIDYTTDTYGFFITHVNVPKAIKDGFSSFYNSPVIPVVLRDIYKKTALPDSVKRGTITTNDSEIYYEETGKGEPVIFIHGHSFNNSEWDQQFFEFGKEYRTIRYDCRGYGRSSVPEKGKEFMHVKDLMFMMNYLNIKKAHLVGLSMGGFIVTDMLALHQNRVISAVAASGDIFPVPGPSNQWTEEGIQKRRDEISQLKKEGCMSQKWKWLYGLSGTGGSQKNEIRTQIWDMIYMWNQWQPLHVEPRLVLGNDAIEILKHQEITVPVMVLTGEKDAWRKNKLMECVPSAKQVIIPDAGHVSNMEQPQVFNVLVKNFIEGRIN